MSNFGIRKHNLAREDVKSTRTYFEKVSKESITIGDIRSIVV